MKRASALAAAGLALGLADAAAPAGGPRHGTASGLSALDKSFLRDTAQSNLGELKYEPLVKKMTNDPATLQFARRTVHDHSQAQQELKTRAASTGYTLPTDTDEEEKQVLARLSREPRPRFDAAYKHEMIRHEMIRDHREDIAKTRREIRLGRNPEVKAYAQKLLTVLQGHLQRAGALPAVAGRTANVKTGNGGAGHTAATRTAGTPRASAGATSSGGK